ncbi:hypothetical protein [Longimicrobium sp.]|uniref:hypothetical protein n=1 Tax=Longimicrobium sp. TaxID=2029185 RepID=UPI002ED77ED2
MYQFAPDGSLIRLARHAGTHAPGQQRVAEPNERAALAGSTRWESVQQGHEVERHCSGIVVARRYDAQAAERVRRASELLIL